MTLEQLSKLKLEERSVQEYLQHRMYICATKSLQRSGFVGEGTGNSLYRREMKAFDKDAWINYKSTKNRNTYR